MPNRLTPIYFNNYYKGENYLGNDSGLLNTHFDFYEIVWVHKYISMSVHNRLADLQSYRPHLLFM